MFDNSQWSQPKEYRVMTDREEFGTQYFDDRQEADSFVYNQSRSHHGRWQLRSRTYGFEAEYHSGILEAFRPTCATLGCLARPTKDYHQWKYCDTCHAKVTEDETAGRQYGHGWNDYMEAVERKQERQEDARQYATEAQASASRQAGKPYARGTFDAMTLFLETGETTRK